MFRFWDDRGARSRSRQEFPGRAQLSLYHRICSPIRQDDLCFGAVGFPEHYVLWQCEGELDQVDIVFSRDLSYHDAVENELTGL